MPKIKIPSSISIGAHSFKIRYHSSDSLKDDGLDGVINHRTQVIEINSSRSPSQQMEAFIHETLHGINATYAKSDLSEHQIGHIAEGLAQVFKELGIELDWGCFAEKAKK